MHTKKTGFSTQISKEVPTVGAGYPLLPLGFQYITKGKETVPPTSLTAIIVHFQLEYILI